MHPRSVGGGAVLIDGYIGFYDTRTQVLWIHWRRFYACALMTGTPIPPVLRHTCPFHRCSQSLQDLCLLVPTGTEATSLRKVHKVDFAGALGAPLDLYRTFTGSLLCLTDAPAFGRGGAVLIDGYIGFYDARTQVLWIHWRRFYACALMTGTPIPPG